MRNGDNCADVSLLVAAQIKRNLFDQVMNEPVTPSVVHGKNSNFSSRRNYLNGT